MPRPSNHRLPVLLTGRAGSGKTERIVDLFLSSGEKEPVNGTLLLLPDRGAAAELRRRIRKRAPDRGFFDGGITTFEEWSGRLLSVDRDDLATPESESLLLLAAAARLPDEIGGRVRSSRFRTAFLGWVSGLRESGIGGEEVRALVEALPTRDRRLELLADTLDAILRMEKEEGLRFAVDLPRRAAALVEADRSSLPLPRLLLVDGFHHFSTARLDLLAALTRRVPETWITLPWADPSDPWMGDAVERSLSALGERIDFVEERIEGGDKPVPPIFLGGSDRREEVERIAREIVRGCVDLGRKPEDHLVLFRNADPYRQIVESEFGAAGIPFRGRFQSAAAESAPGRSLLDVLDLARSGLTRETIDSFIKNRMFGIDAGAADRIVAGWAGRPEPEGSDALVDQIAARNPGFASERIEPLRRFREEMEQAGGGDRVRLVRDSWLEWITPSLRPGSFPDEELAFAGSALRRLTELLGRLAAAADRFDEIGRLDRTEMIDLVEDEVRRTRIRTTAGDGRGVRIDDYRHGQNLRAPVVFLAGLEAKICPRPYEPGPFWNESDRERLGATGQFRLEDRNSHAGEERFLFRRACERATEKLFLTAPSFSPDGSSAAESPFRQEIRRELGDRNGADRGPVERFATPDALVFASDLLPFLASRCDPAEGDETGVAIGARLAADLPLALPDRPRSFKENVRLSAVPAFRRWWKEKREFSVTELEDFQACPYRYLARHLFRLREPRADVEFGLPIPDEGVALHTILERWSGGEEELGPLIADVLAEARGDFPERVGHRIAAESLERDLARLIEADDLFRRRYRWTPEEFEFRFGGDAKRPFTVGDGIGIRGRIDRLDKSESGEVLVVDYKRTARSRNELARELEEGRNLALPLYVLAAAEATGRRPAGVFLLGVREAKRGGFYDEDLAGDGPMPERKEAGGALPLGGDEFRETLEKAVRFTGETVQEIGDGEFPVEPASDDLCNRLSCPYRDLCRVVIAAREGEERK